MRQPLAIVQIVRRSDQGATQPFHCRCEDGRLYFVKGRSAGPRSLLCEWLAGHLARALGLPVPEFAVVKAPPELLSAHTQGAELGLLPAFASHAVAITRELIPLYLEQVNEELKRELAVFDWWIRNQDRTLSTNSGNPNLLWDDAENRLVVIDHNLAFDRDFDARTFIDTHVFGSSLIALRDDDAAQERLLRKLRAAKGVWAQACNDAPADWWFADEERTIPVDFDRDAALSLLNRCETTDFWRFEA